MKINNFIYILIAAYLATFLRLIINNNFVVSIIGSFLVGFFISKRLSHSIEKILLSGFFSCFTSFSGFIYFLYKILNQGDWIKFIIFFKVKKNSLFCILLAAYLATFLRLTIDHNFIISVIGSFLVGFFISKRLSYSIEKILLSGFFSSFTSFSGFIYFLYKILNQGDWIKFIIFFNLIIVVNLLTMCFGFWMSRKLT